ncbi:Tab2/Atab2 family RNA-binding protein [Crocosphaera sp.]|uniref:Tab2/Atab2 family RNA-binding protein n=1 Tax=Crocosphaera sp. TaxID=2729996 RepID=UPI002607747C|nr:Tab2/Atab2 family RNA-binding protein [Crocosphaera sp.]MDJ0580763.1 Tab2/Atab2 family RNA-binding protein [Crocosphaera sp.]
MIIWQADFYKHLSQENEDNTVWNLIVCDQNSSIIHQGSCQQSEANSNWLITELESLVKQYSPDLIKVFRPQCLSLFQLFGKTLGVKIEASRRTPQLKQILKEKFPSSLKLKQLPPQAVPENLWGDKWRFATFKAGDFFDYFRDRPIPIKDLSEELNPIDLGIASGINIPGVVIYGGRKSMYLARWLADNKPFSLNYIPTEVGKSGGLILESRLVDRWVLLTFEDSEMAQSAQKYEQQKESSQGLHFLLIQPDDSGMTETGIWLLKKEDI